MCITNTSILLLMLNSEIQHAPVMEKSGERTKTPFNEAILKVASRCNLACDYCYVYESVDQSHRKQPPFMSDETVLATAQAFSEHATTHDIEDLFFVIHGGEPLLIERSRPGFLRSLVETFRATIRPETNIHFSIQTNGTLLDIATLNELNDLEIKVGVSVDGDKLMHDRHRKYHNGRGSFRDVSRGIAYLNQEEYRKIRSGLLCTVNLDNNPIETIEALETFDPDHVDLLLPLATWDDLPYGYESVDDLKEAKYGKWLWPIYQRWRQNDRKPSIRFFQEIEDHLIKGEGSAEYLGLKPPGNIVVETNGELQQVDTLKVAFDGAPATGYNVHEHSLDLVLENDPITKHRRMGAKALSTTCQRCILLEPCGGGYIPFRSKANEDPELRFKNEAVYCEDYKYIFGCIAHRLGQDEKQKLYRELAGRMDRFVLSGSKPLSTSLPG